MKCPLCHGPVEGAALSGLLINRRAFLRSQLLILRQEKKDLTPLAASMAKQSEKFRVLLQKVNETIVAHETELLGLA